MSCSKAASSGAAALKKHLILVGNPGTGKSTILNCYIGPDGGSEGFESGISFGEGRTKVLQMRIVGDTVYMDTPGLADQKLREAAAQAIKEGLTKDGLYKVFFVLTLINGRVSSQDVTTMKLVLNAAPSITHYGIIINQVGLKSYKQIQQDQEKKDAVLAALWFNFDKDRQTPYIHFNPEDPDLKEEDNVSKPLPAELRAFIDSTPGMAIESKDVEDVATSEWEAMQKQLEDQLAKLTADLLAKDQQFEQEKKEIFDRMKTERAEADRRMAELLQQHRAEMQAETERIQRESERRAEAMRIQMEEQKEAAKEALRTQMEQQQQAEEARRIAEEQVRKRYEQDMKLAEDRRAEMLAAEIEKLKQQNAHTPQKPEDNKLSCFKGSSVPASNISIFNNAGTMMHIRLYAHSDPAQAVSMNTDDIAPQCYSRMTCIDTRFAHVYVNGKVATRGWGIMCKEGCKYVWNGSDLRLVS